MKYMKRVSAELEIVVVGVGPEEEELIVQGVRFAFRVHQVIFSFCFILSFFIKRYSSDSCFCFFSLLGDST